jgi:uncharacterized small protein (DUF1192 family)
MNVNKQDTLHDAVFKGDIDNIDRLISEGCDVNEIREGNGTPLNLLTIYRHDFWDHSEPNLNKKLIVIAKKLLQAGADPNIAISPNAYLPLYQTVEYGDTELVDLLLRYQADPNIHGVYYEEEKYTPLIRAIQDEDGEMTRLLLTKADPTFPDLKGMTPLEYALTTLITGDEPITAGMNLRYLLSHPKINSNAEEVQEKVVNTVMDSSIINLLNYYDDEKTLLEIKSRISEGIQACVFGGFKLAQDSLYYSTSEPEQLNCIKRLQEEIARTRQEIEDEEESISQAEALGISFILYDNDTLASIIKTEIFPFITATITQAETLKAERIKPLDPWKTQLHKYPVFERQFLLASDEERKEILSKLEQLKGIEFDTLNRLFFSYQAQQKDFLNLKAVWDSQVEKNQTKLMPTLKFFQLPPELFQNILKELVKGPYKPYMFGKELNEAIEPQLTSALEPSVSSPRMGT